MGWVICECQCFSWIVCFRSFCHIPLREFRATSKNLVALCAFFLWKNLWKAWWVLVWWYNFFLAFFCSWCSMMVKARFLFVHFGWIDNDIVVLLPKFFWWVMKYNSTAYLFGDVFAYFCDFWEIGGNFGYSFLSNLGFCHQCVHN